MATMTRGRCVFTRFDKKILCAGTMDQWIEIQKRVQTGVTDPDQLEPTEEFVTVMQMPGRIESSRRVPRFDGVNTESGTTDICYINFDQSIYELDINTLYVRREGIRPRRFKLVDIDPYDEEGMFLELGLTERGFEDQRATQA